MKIRRVRCQECDRIIKGHHHKYKFCNRHCNNIHKYKKFKNLKKKVGIIDKKYLFYLGITQGVGYSVSVYYDGAIYEVFR